MSKKKTVKKKANSNKKLDPISIKKEVSNISDDRYKPKTKPKEKEERLQYAFLTKYRCPRCRSVSTIANGSYINKQYRVCRMPTCRKRFSVYGEKV